MYFYVPDVKFNFQCQIAEVYFIAHALDCHKDFNIEQYFTNSSKISQMFQVSHNFSNISNNFKRFKTFQKSQSYKNILQGFQRFHRISWFVNIFKIFRRLHFKLKHLKYFSSTSSILLRASVNEDIAKIKTKISQMKVIFDLIQKKDEKFICASRNLSVFARSA